MSKISVIVPVYNVEKYLNRCVDSILNQTFSDFELILVDDGSPDSCGKICDEYAQKDNRVHVIHQDNGGLSAARNAGLDWSFANSDSEWVTFIDSDDWIRKDSLELMYNAVTQQNTNLCIAKFYFVDYTFEKEDESCKEPQKMEIVKFYNRFTNEINVISACAKLYKKEQWRDIRFPVGKLNEDRFTTHKLIFQNTDASVLDVPLYYYLYQNLGSIMNSWNPRRLDDIEAVKEQLKFFKERNLHDAWEKAVFDHIMLLMQFVKILDKINPEYKKYRRKLKRDLNFAVIKYELIGAISIKRDMWIFERVFPKTLCFLWKLNDVRRKIFNISNS